VREPTHVRCRHRRVCKFVRVDLVSVGRKVHLSRGNRLPSLAFDKHVEQLVSDVQTDKDRADQVGEEELASAPAALSEDGKTAGLRWGSSHSRVLTHQPYHGVSDDRKP
jgi:hypothetical protein